jgi:hypothetical protein
VWLNSAAGQFIPCEFATGFADRTKWLIPVGMEWDEKADWFTWPGDDDENDPE